MELVLRDQDPVDSPSEKCHKLSGLLGIQPNLACHQLEDPKYIIISKTPFFESE